MVSSNHINNHQNQQKKIINQQDNKQTKFVFKKMGHPYREKETSSDNDM